jgi:hypothetical protein
METVNAQFIAGIDTLSGNAPVDFVLLKDGRVIGIDNESVVLYASIDDFYSFDTVDRASFSLTEEA